MKLKEIRLPAGDVGSIAIGWGRNGAERVYDPVRDWLSQGYGGVRFIGAGVDRTHLRCRSWDGITLGVGRHPGVVQLENLTLHAGFEKGIHFGEQNQEKALTRAFQLKLLGVSAKVPGPLPGRARTKWLLFGYQADVGLQDVELDATEAREHAFYFHGAARYGWLWERVKMRGSGAEGFKVRSDTTETAWAGPKVMVVIRDCSFRNWYQTWSDRGGAAVVLQGAAAGILIERSEFWGGGELPGIPVHQRGRAIAISSEGDSYDTVTGKPNVGFGNGDVIIRQCAARAAGTAPSWHNNLVRIARNGGAQQAANSVVVENSGFWGDNYLVSVADVPKGKTTIRGCNTPKLREYADSIGMAADFEASINLQGNPLVPVSRGATG